MKKNRKFIAMLAVILAACFSFAAAAAPAGPGEMYCTDSEIQNTAIQSPVCYLLPDIKSAGPGAQNGTADKKPEDFIIDTAYSEDPEIRNIMKQYFSIVTGEMKTETISSKGKEYAVIKKGANQKEYDFLSKHNAVIGTGLVAHTKNRNDFYVVSDQDTEYAKAQLNALYEMMIKAQSETTGMSDMDKALYVLNTLYTTLTYENGQYFAGTAAITKVGCCSAYAVLAELMGKACGINITTESGRNVQSGGAHEWNRVTIDGTDYILDATYKNHLMVPEVYYTTVRKER